jgi:hypothetical protein
MLEPYLIGSTLNRQKLPELLQTIPLMTADLVKAAAKEICVLDDHSQVDLLTAGQPSSVASTLLLPEVLALHDGRPTPFDYTQSSTLLRTVLECRGRGVIDNDQAVACITTLVAGYEPETDQTFLPVLAHMGQASCRWVEQSPELDTVFARHIERVSPRGFFEQHAAKALARTYLPMTSAAVARRMSIPELTNLVVEVVDRVGIDRQYDALVESLDEQVLLSIHDQVYGVADTESITVDLIKRLPADRIITDERAAHIQSQLALYRMPPVLIALMNDPQALSVDRVTRLMGDNIDKLVNNIDGVFAHNNFVDVAKRAGKTQSLVDSIVSMGRILLKPAEGFDPSRESSETIVERIMSVSWGTRDGQVQAKHYHQNSLMHLQSILQKMPEMTATEPSKRASEEFREPRRAVMADDLAL